MSPVSLIHGDSVVTMMLESPILARHVLTELAESLDSLALGSPPLPVVLASAHPTIFLAGAHLGEISELDSVSCVAYAEAGRAVAERLGSHPAPVVASVHGSCSGGGFDLVMACDAIVASPTATFAHPGVRRGLVTGWGGTVHLPRVLGPAAARRAFLDGGSVDATTLEDLGVIGSIAEDPLSEARATTRRLDRLHPSRLEIWRRLRGPNFVDRFRAFVVEKS